jgi:hypothetical protein
MHTVGNSGLIEEVHLGKIVKGRKVERLERWKGLKSG